MIIEMSLFALICRHVPIDIWIMVLVMTEILMGCVTFQKEVFGTLTVMHLVQVRSIYLLLL